MTLCTPWISESDLVDCSCDTATLSPGAVEDLLFAASDWMYQKTGARWPGNCEVTERPCGCGCGCGLLTTQWALMNGSAISGSCCDGLCGCSAEAKVALTYGPVQTATVSIDGIAFTNFEIVQPNLLVRTDGAQWPSCQSYLDGWTVTYTYGADPPMLARLAAQDLTVELVKACTGQDCALPSNVISVTRRGVTFTADPDLIGKSLTRVALALDVYGRNGQADLVIPGKRGLITTGPVGS